MAELNKSSSYIDRKGIGANPLNVPQHVAIIMDGNGRWAKSRGLPRTAGHRQGVETVQKIVKHSLDAHIPVLTLFAFGRENWRRPAQEVRNLQRIFLLALRREVKKLNEHGVRLRIIGERSVYPLPLIQAMVDAETLTASNTKMTLNLAINYSGRWDLVESFKKISQLVQNESLDPTLIDETLISQYTSLHHVPEPDLFIRTGGVQRISNFILWEMAYTELYFTHLLWPDFKKEDYQHALESFSKRERRFGLTSQQVEAMEC